MDLVACSLVHLQVSTSLTPGTQAYTSRSMSCLNALHGAFVLVVKTLCNTDVSCPSSPSVFSRVRQVHRQQDAEEDSPAGGNTTPVR